MKTLNKLLAFPLMACLALSTVTVSFGLTGKATHTAVAAEAVLDDSTDDHFYYKQLKKQPDEFTDEHAKMRQQLYQAMEDMNKNGDFIKGADYDLVAHGRVTQAQLDAYANGDYALLDALGAARDAFYTDYAEVFYVDFSYLSMRITQDTTGEYHAYLGKGRSDTYLLEGFQDKNETQIRSAITTYEQERDKVVELARAAKPTQDQIDGFGNKELATQVAQIREAHKQIALTTTYKLEIDATPGNEGHVRTPYGVFVKGESLCEGYSRAFKAVMGKLGVPCVLVFGGYRHTETKVEDHMWTYVKLKDKKWYAVDQTFDDLNGKQPVISDNTERSLNYEYTEEYFLKGAALMNAQHVTSKYMSGAEYEFRYPVLSEYDIGTEVSEHGIIMVAQEPNNPQLTSTDIKVSILIDGEWYGQREAIKSGYYLLIRYEGNYLPEKLAAVGSTVGADLTNDNTPEGEEHAYAFTWAYVFNPTFPEDNLYGNIKDYTGYTVIENESKATGFEFAVTTIPPRSYDPELMNSYTLDQIMEMTTFLGDQSMFVARTGLIATKYGDPNYQPAPYIVRATPTQTSMLNVTHGTYDVKVEYDQLLELMDGAKKISFSVYGMRANGEVLKGTNAVPSSVVSDINWYGGELKNGEFINSYVTFKFTPSKLFAHDNIAYIFNFNLQGVNTKKQVNPLIHAAATPGGYCSLGVPGYNWRVFGQPSLMENADDIDFSAEGWETADGTDLSQFESIKSRMALVVTTPSQKRENDMNQALAEEFGYTYDENEGESSLEGVTSIAFNIDLTICKACIVKAGEKLRVSVGFPEGFTYDSSLEGVTFKAYHFIHDDQNHITGVEEISCTVTELGLIIICDSFSPFAIVINDTGEPHAATEKTVMVSSLEGGATYEGTTKTNMFTLDEGASKTMAVKANEGYVIESIRVNNTPVSLSSTELTQTTVTLNYDELPAGQSIVEVKYVLASIKQAEVDKGLSAVVPVEVLRISAMGVVSERVGNDVVLQPKVTLPSGRLASEYTYQWYKDGVALEGQTGKTLTITDATTADSGVYILKVTDKSNTTLVVESDAINVTVKAASKGCFGEIINVTIALAGTVLLALPVLVMGKKSKKKS